VCDLSGRVLPSKREDLSSNPSSNPHKKKKVLLVYVAWKWKEKLMDLPILKTVPALQVW
jgi:hypothetical protein